MDREVTLMEMLEAREVRAGRQRELLARYARPVVSFTLNIAGPVKNGPVIRRAFREGLLRLEDALAARGLRPLHQEEVDRPTGCEALWAVDGPARTAKELCALVGITEANLSILRSGKASGVRFHTINRICYYLQCDVGDILRFDGRLEDDHEER